MVAQINITHISHLISIGHWWYLRYIVGICTVNNFIYTDYTTTFTYKWDLSSFVGII